MTTLNGHDSRRVAEPPSGLRPLVVIAGAFTFPEGTGATSRAACYAKGLRECGADVLVVCLAATSSRSEAAEGVHEGTRYVHTAGSRPWPCARLARLARNAGSAWHAGRHLGRARRSGVDRTIVYFGLDDPFRFALVWGIGRLYGYRIVGEKSEMPFVYSRPDRLTRAKRRLMDAWGYRALDGLLVISRCLERYFEGRLRRGVSALRLPIIVDHESIDRAVAVRLIDNLVVYCGNLGHRDEILGLLRSFRLALDSVPVARLEIAGAAAAGAVPDEYLVEAERLGIADRVCFRGHLPKSEVATLLKEASALALPRPSGAFSQAGFPTKLGEYLASGNPVVVTRTGDIAEYLVDRVHAYLVPPDDDEAFASGLVEAMSSPSAHRIGRAGRLVAVREFDATHQASRLLDYLGAVANPPSPKRGRGRP